MIEILEKIEQLKAIAKMCRVGTPRYEIVDKCNEIIRSEQKKVDEFEQWSEQKKVDEFEQWAEEESAKQIELDFQDPKKIVTDCV